MARFGITKDFVSVAGGYLMGGALGLLWIGIGIDKALHPSGPPESTKTVLACDRSPEGMTIIRDESTGLVEHLRSWEYGDRISRVGVKFIEPAKTEGGN